jgi:transposase InsO family protein
MVDTHTKGIKLEPTNITITTRGTSNILKDQVFCEEGLPQKVYSNHRLQFISRFMKELYCSLGIEANLSTAYHLQTDGQTERINQEVERYLQTFVNEEQDN